MIHRLFDRSFLKFVIVGILNSITGTSVMLILYRYLNWGYWGSSAVSYALSSILSFFLNKNFTFRSSSKLSSSAIKFTLNIIICYTLAYLIAKPLVFISFEHLAINASLEIREQIAMFAGMGIFTLLNYFGQRKFVFIN